MFNSRGMFKGLTKHPLGEIYDTVILKKGLLRIIMENIYTKQKLKIKLNMIVFKNT